MVFSEFLINSEVHTESHFHNMNISGKYFVEGEFFIINNLYLIYIHLEKIAGIVCALIYNL